MGESETVQRTRQIKSKNQRAQLAKFLGDICVAQALWGSNEKRQGDTQENKRIKQVNRKKCREKGDGLL